MRRYNMVADNLAKWEKYGIARGIIFMLEEEMRSRGLNKKDWLREYDGGFKQYCVTFVIPTSSERERIFDYPHFYYGEAWGLIDMIHFNDELQFHFMRFDHEKGWINGYWHTVREGLSLSDTMVLYEYINDCKSSLILLDADEHDKYNSTGAIGV